LRRKVDPHGGRFAHVVGVKRELSIGKSECYREIMNPGCVAKGSNKFDEPDLILSVQIERDNAILLRFNGKRTALMVEQNT
jgi:hypothetical protein